MSQDPRDVLSIVRTLGFDPDALGPTTIDRAVERRMQALGLDRASRDAYLARLEALQHERQELIEELVVQESWFFRDGEPFSVLRQFAATWLAEPGRPPLRALSIPCSRGEEPYSIALTLLELDLPHPRFRIDAVDISRPALERARQGVYSEKALRGMAAGLRGRYFREHRDGWELLPRVRQTVRFLQGDLLDPELLRGQGPYDAIFCRNLLIYLTPPARERAVAALDRLLGPSGLLFVGHAERSPLLESRFEPVPVRGSFAYQRVNPESFEVARRARSWSITASPVSAPLSQPAPTGLMPGGPSRSVRAALGPSASDVPAPGAPAPVATGPTCSDPPETTETDLLDQAAALANQKRFDEAAAGCERALEHHGPSARAYHLLGMIQQATGQYERAEQSLSKAVYLDSEDDDALLALSLLARRRGDLAASESYQRRAERARQRKTSS